MSNILKMTTALAVVAGFAGVASADTGNPASDTATASVTVVAPITVTNVDALEIGSIVADDVAYTASIAAALNATTTTGSGPTPLDVSGSNPASFTVASDDGYAWSANTPAPFLLSSGANNMTFTPVLSANATNSLTNGIDTIYLGGSLAVGASQPAGNYTGSVTVSVDYD